MELEDKTILFFSYKNLDVRFLITYLFIYYGLQYSYPVIQFEILKKHMHCALDSCFLLLSGISVLPVKQRGEFGIML